MIRAVVLMLVSLFVLSGCGQPSSPVEREEKQHGLDEEARQQETATPTATAEVEGNIPIAGVVGENVATDSYDLRVLDIFETDRYFYLSDPTLDDVQDYYSTAGKFVVVSYSVTNTGAQTVGPNVIARLHARAGDKVEVYEQSDQIVPGHRSSAELYLEDIPPRQMLVSQFVFDVPTDVEPELLAVTEEPQLGTVLDVGVVDLRDEDPQGPRPEEILALQYEYTNMEDWERAYELYAQESKDKVTLQQYVGSWEGLPDEAITKYSFPSVEIDGDRATIERVFTSETSEGEGQFKATQEAVLEDEGWRIVMREDQIDFFLSGGETTG